MNLRAFLIPCLLCAGIDVGLFHKLFTHIDTLSYAHIVSFLVASAIGLGTFSLVKNRVEAKQIISYIFLALLVLFLRGGLLATLLQSNALPALAAILITSIFSAVLLFAAFLYTQKITTDTLCIAAVGYIVLLKLLYLGAPELLFEEAYYWNYAQHLDIGYLDHPLIVAWTIKAFTLLLGNNEFALRLGAFLYWFVTAYFVFKLTEEVVNKTVAYRALLLVGLLPAFFSFGFFMSPDAPLTACWSASIYYIYQALTKENVRAWLYFGLALGLGMSSKYTIALLAAAVVLYMLFNQNARKWFAQPQPYIAALIALALFSPVIIWNMQHHWLSFTFQSTGRVEHGHHFSLPRYISNILILLTPTGLLAAVTVIAERKKLLALNKNYWLLMWLALFPVTVYAVFSLFTASKLNWTGPCWLALLPIFALMMTQDISSENSKLATWSKRAWPATLAILVLGYGASLHYLSIGFPYVPFPQNTHLLGFQSLASEVEKVRKQLSIETGNDILVVGMDRNKIASGLAFYRAKNNTEPYRNPAFDTASEHLFGDVGLMYELWFPIAAQSGKSMLLVSESARDLNNEAVISRVENAGEIKAIDAYKAGKVTGHYHYRLVEGYHTP